MAYLKPQRPIIYTEPHVYPLTTDDQVILANGKRLEQTGVVVAEKLGSPKAISLAGDVTGTVNFDGSNNVTIQTTVSASKYYSAILSASNWSSSAPYTQTVVISGIKSTDNPIVDIDMSSATSNNSSDLLNAWNRVGRISTNNNSIIAYCYEEKPTVDISLVLLIIK